MRSWYSGRVRRRSRKAAVRRSINSNVTPMPYNHPMDLGPIIRIIEKVPAALPAEREPRPTPAQPAPAKEPAPV